MKTFEYQLLRYSPDAVSGEFVNVGVLVFDAEGKKLAGRFLDRIARVSQFFPAINGRYLSKVLRHISSDVERIAAQFNTELDVFPFAGVEQVSKDILAKDDSSLFFTETLKGLDISIEAILDNLYDRSVASHIQEDDRKLTSDKDVWTKVYKKHFEKKKILGRLKHHKVQTAMDTFEFDHSWKNGHWNCFEPLNFDLRNSRSIKDKAYKWKAKLNELNHANEELHVYMLSALPKDKQLQEFIKQMIGSVNNEKVKVELIERSEAKALADKIAVEIEEHA